MLIHELNLFRNLDENEFESPIPESFGNLTKLNELFDSNVNSCFIEILIEIRYIDESLCENVPESILGIEIFSLCVLKCSIVLFLTLMFLFRNIRCISADNESYIHHYRDEEVNYYLKQCIN